MINDTLDISIRGQNFTLLKEKAAYWQEKKTLLIADVHAGKAAHFRKNGIPLSTDHLLLDLNIIEQLLAKTGAQKLSFLGDLFHSSANVENDLIQDWVKNLHIETELVIGNHDIYSYKQSKIRTTQVYEQDGILLSHEPVVSEYFNICGHLHPAFMVGGKGRNYVKLPSFYLNADSMILPAFGSVNGCRMYKELIKKYSVILSSDEGLIKIN